MRVLWFTNTPSLYINSTLGYNGGGWISSLESEMKSLGEVDLGICFFYFKTAKEIKDGVIYYPINVKSTLKNKIQYHFAYKNYQKQEVKLFMQVVDDFKPDIIHVFGSEFSFGLIKKHTDTPVVLHLQGIMNPYLNAFFPPGVGKFDYLKNLPISECFSKFQHFKFFLEGAEREKEILALCNNFMGRTSWDRRVVNLFSPNCRYFYCSEILREPFYQAKAWKYSFSHSKLIILTTISKSEYKGFDLILKAAQLLKNELNINFEWNVCGIENYRFWENKMKIKAKDVNVNCLGVVNADDLVELIQKSTIFVHPSYIDNSPNSICEAQMLGIPVISTNVGGVSSLIEDENTGFLIPANDPYTLVSKLQEIWEDIPKAIEVGNKGRKIALKRHDKLSIVESNIKIYKLILNK